MADTHFKGPIVVTGTGTGTNTGNQTIAGTLVVTGALTATAGLTGDMTGTLTGNQIMPVAAVAALGSIQTDAALVAYGFTHATGADATKGVRLPAAAAGRICIIKNSDAANAVLKIWPATSDAINAIAADGNYVLAAKTSAILIALDAVTWYSIPLLAS